MKVRLHKINGNIEEYEAQEPDNSKFPTDNVVVLPDRLTIENGGKVLIHGDFHETINIVCPNCYGWGEEDGECEICNGTELIPTKVYVSWTTIKEIYKKIVENLAYETYKAT